MLIRLINCLHKGFTRVKEPLDNTWNSEFLRCSALVYSLPQRCVAFICSNLRNTHNLHSHSTQKLPTWTTIKIDHKYFFKSKMKQLNIHYY